MAVECRIVSFSLEEQTIARAPEKVVVLVIEKKERPGVGETYESAGEGLLTVQPLCLVSRPCRGATLRHCAAVASPPSPSVSSRLLAAPGAPEDCPGVLLFSSSFPVHAELILILYDVWTFPDRQTALFRSCLVLELLQLVPLYSLIR